MKKVYENIYAFQVIDAVKDGKDVRVLDRETEIVKSADEMPASEFIYAVNNADAGRRFDFWAVVESVVE